MSLLVFLTSGAYLMFHEANCAMMTHRECIAMFTDTFTVGM